MQFLTKKYLPFKAFALFFLLWPACLKAQVDFGYHSAFKYLKGRDASQLSYDWMQQGYDDSGWSEGNAPFRYGDGTGGTVLTDMAQSYSTLFLRTGFLASSVDFLSEIQLTIDYDDGFIIWINGREVLRRNAPDNAGYNSFATQNHESGLGEIFILETGGMNLVEGENTLAVIGLNVSMESSDFYFDISLNAEIGRPQLADSIGLSFDMPSGFYDEPFTLTVASPDPEASIIYTLDGSNPQTSDNSFTTGNPAGISIDPAIGSGRGTTPAVVLRASIVKDGYKPSFPESRSYIFLEKVKDQSYPGGSWPGQDINSQVIDLDMDTRITRQGIYAGQIEDALLDIPSVSISTDPGNLFDPATGIYVNAEGHGLNWERECSVELIYPDGSEGFSVNAGLRIRGGWSRHPDFPKHAFRLFFRATYGDPKLYYPLFGDEGVDRFDKVDLRCAQNYAWSNGDSRNTMVRDVFSRDTQKDMDQPYTRSRYYHLYLNGMYWGVFQTQERSEARYAADYFGGQTEDYDVIKVNTEDYVYQIEVTDGGMDNWQKIWQMTGAGFSANRSFFNLEGKDEFGEHVKGAEVLVDIDNLIDYMLVIFYTGNFDSPTTAFRYNKYPNNFYAVDNRKDRSKGFTFYAHDCEHAMFSDYVYPTNQGLYEDRVNIGDLTDENRMFVENLDLFHPQWLHYKLTFNAEYRMRFADRANKHFSEDGVFSITKATGRLNQRVAEIETAIIAESARWGDARDWVTSPYTKDGNWVPEIEKLRNDFIPRRNNIVINQLKGAGLYSSLYPPRIEQSGTVLPGEQYTLSSGISIGLVNPYSSGLICYTLDGTDPRMVGGSIRPDALKADSYISLDISTSAWLRARIYRDGIWSALREMKFLSASEDFSSLEITELHYNPLASYVANDTVPGKEFEFIEFKNTGDNWLNLSGLVLDSAIHYTFPDMEMLGPGQFYVIASGSSTFYARYGFAASGIYSGSLANGGETIVLQDFQGNTILHFHYDDADPWPLGADGEGYSLVSVEYEPSGNPGDPDYWRNSSAPNGSPFANDPYPAGILAETGSPEGIRIYPNPASSTIKISLDQASEKQLLKISLYNPSGILLYQSEIENHSQLHLEELGISSGVYFIRVLTGGFAGSSRFIYLAVE